ncbi:ABC transporter ATP-binding protein [Hominifimenecus sp. rT4P-3]|uniref:ABC transporter ATP-binding protein n=1 Tax=Hominifimenecus sp. rT4P-3 TaxID=3242979 RepID=UPI003DA3A198
MFRRFASYYRPHWKLFAFDMTCAFLAAVGDLFYPLIAKNMINDYVPNQNLRLLLIWASVLLGIYVLKAVLTYMVQYWGHIVGVRIQGDMREKMFRHLQKLPFAFFDENKTGTIMSRMINDLMDISELAHHGPEDLFISAIQLVGAFILLCTINIPLTLIVFAVLPFIVYFAQKTRHMMKDSFRETRVEMAEINANIETAIAGIRVSRSYTADTHETAKFMKANQRFKNARGRAYRSMGVFFSGMGFMMDFLYLLVLFAGGLFFFKKWINTGEFAAYLLYIAMFLKPIQKLVNIFEQLQNGITGFQRYEEILAEKPELESPDAEVVDTLHGEIEFQHVTFRYENSDASEAHKDVIHDLSFHLDAGKMVAFVGPSGGGKTTVCHLIPRFYELQSGSITIDGKDIRNISRYSLRKNIGMVAQDVFIFDGTIRENIAYGDLDATEEQIVEAAKRAQIHDYILTLENGYDTQVGERGVRLSGGQKQRLSIARAFLKNPPILILDEATSALDNMTEMQIQESLEELSKGRTTLVVAHRLSTIKNADEILVLTAGGIEERGSHEELLAKGGIYASLYQYTLR